MNPNQYIISYRKHKHVAFYRLFTALLYAGVTFILKPHHIAQWHCLHIFIATNSIYYGGVLTSFNHYMQQTYFIIVRKILYTIQRNVSARFLMEYLV